MERFFSTDRANIQAEGANRKPLPSADCLLLVCGGRHRGVDVWPIQAMKGTETERRKRPARRAVATLAGQLFRTQLLRLGIDHMLVGLIVCVAALVTAFYAVITIPPAPKFDIWANPYAQLGAADPNLTSGAASLLPPHHHDTMLGDSLAGLMFFFQISDLHLSEKQQRDYRVYDRFDQFCKIVRHMRPEFVACTGDLTDSKTSILHGQQNETEWKIYKDILVKNGLFDPRKWIDLAGNHDRYGVPSSNSTLNYFARYSTTSARNDTFHANLDFNGVYSSLFRTAAGSFRVVVLDTSLPIGVSFPLNFHSLLYRHTLEAFQGELETAAAENSTAVVVGHYPSTTINSPLIAATQSGFSDVHALYPFPAYLCGHLHMNNLYTRMSTTSSKEFLELELADFKSKEVFRILAFDSGLLSFIDVKLDRWPAILVLNPKDARFLLPQEPLHRIAQSTHIRALVFSTYPIQTVSVWIDDEFLGNMLPASNNVSDAPLYVQPWTPTRYSNRMHLIRVVATDTNGDVTTVEHQFSLDGQAARLSLFASIMQTRELKLVFNYVFFGVYIVVMLFFLLIPKCFWIAVELLHTKYTLFGSIYDLYFSMRHEHFSSLPSIEATTATDDDKQPDVNDTVDASEEAEQMDSAETTLFQPLTQESPQPESKDAKSEPVQHPAPRDSIFTILLKGFMAYMFHFARIPTFQWIVLFGSGVLFLVMPWVIAPNLGEGTGLGVVTLWGIWCNGIFLPSVADVMEHTGLPVLCFMWMPLVLYVALPHYHSPIRGELLNTLVGHSKHTCYRHWVFIHSILSLFWARGAIFVLSIFVCMIALNVVYVAAYGLLTMVLSPILLWWSGVCVAMIVSTQALQARAVAPQIAAAAAKLHSHPLVPESASAATL